MCPLMDVAEEEMKIFLKGKYKDDGTLDWSGLIYTECKNTNIFLAMTPMQTWHTLIDDALDTNMDSPDKWVYHL